MATPAETGTDTTATPTPAAGTIGFEVREAHKFCSGKAIDPQAHPPNQEPRRRHCDRAARQARLFGPRVCRMSLTRAQDLWVNGKPDAAKLKEHLFHEGRLHLPDALKLIEDVRSTCDSPNPLQATAVFKMESNVIEVDAPITGETDPASHSPHGLHP